MRSLSIRSVRSLRPGRAAAVVVFSVVVLVASSAQSAFALSNYRYRGWGFDQQGQIGIGTADIQNPLALAPSPDNVTWSQLSSNGYNTVALKSDGTVWAFGDNTFGQLGQGNVCEPVSGTNCGGDTPVEVKTATGFLTGVTQVAAGFYHNLAMTSTGAVYAWGYNQFGQLGDNTTTDKSVATPVKNAAGTGNLVATEIAGGFYHSLAIVGTGAAATAYGWGQNLYAQLGNNAQTNRLLPTAACAAPPTNCGGTLTNVQKLAGGNDHTVALLNDGSSYAWGAVLGTNNPNHGQLCDSATTGKKVPNRISIEGTLTDIGVGGGGFHTLLLKSNNQVRACGFNGNGQLGNGLTADSSAPVPVKNRLGQTGNLTNITAVVGCGFFSMALDSTGAVWAWGDNGNGQLGNGDTTFTSSPLPVAVKNSGGALTGVVAISCGYSHSMALMP